MPTKKTKKQKEVSSEEELDDNSSDHKPAKKETKSKVINVDEQSDSNSDVSRVKQDVENNSSDEDEDSEIDMGTEFMREDVDDMDLTTLQNAMDLVSAQICKLEDELGEDAYDEHVEGGSLPVGVEVETFVPPPHCVPIRKDVRLVDFDALGKECQFDVILMDPPWQLASSQPTRGVAIGYKQLPNKDIMDIPIPKVQKNGFLFIWVINARYAFALDMFEKWGYTLVDDITWVKTTVNRRMAKGHGFYLQHAKETCLVGKKGADPPGMKGNILSDIIFAERRGQSQKPEELYEYIETLVPNGKYMEIFARRNNLRNYWVSIGNEL